MGADRNRFVTLYLLPTFALLVWAILPLARGGRTLYLRDVFNTHLEMKWTQAAAMRQGYLPLVDPFRGGGQAHLGNPNTVPLYPDNLLYLVASPLWALNAHFWIHLLVAPVGIYLLGRAWGLRRESSWAAGVCYAASGYFLSQLNLYNLVAGVALAPLFAAVLLRLAAGDAAGRRAALPGAAAIVWGLLLLAGDPVIAILALAVALSAVVVRHGPRPPGVGALAVALVLGTLLAAPQIVEFLRILPTSFRGLAGFSVRAGTAASWNPVTALEWLLPLLFGPPDFTFWGHRFYSGQPPLYYTLYPGLLALVLVGAAGPRRDRAFLWSWSLVGVGIFVALGRFNPLFEWLWALPPARLFRFPVKFWLPVAVGAALLCGLGFERLLGGAGRRAAGRVLALLALGFVAAWLFLSLSPLALGELIPDRFGPGFVEQETVRWAGLCLLSLLLTALLAAGVLAIRRRPLAAGAALLALHLGVQLFLLRPLLGSEEVAAYRSQPGLVRVVPERALVVHGRASRLFGPATIPVEQYPDQRLLWLQRQTWEELYPWAGALWGRRYDYNLSPEGLDSFFTRVAAQAMERLDDGQRLRLLAAAGVDLLLLGRALEPEARVLAEPIHRAPRPGGTTIVYRLKGRPREVRFLGEVHRSPHLNATLALLTDPAFDPARAVVLPGEGPPVLGRGGTARIVRRGPESVVVEVEAESPGVLVYRRAFLPIYRARIDGEEAPLVVANMDRVGVELPAGAHRVEIWADRGPLRWSGATAVAALLALGLFCWWSAGRGHP